MILSQSDSKRLSDAITDVNQQRKKGTKCTMEIHLDCGNAKIYHMGQNNPVIRIDLKVGECIE